MLPQSDSEEEARSTTKGHQSRLEPPWVKMPPPDTPPFQEDWVDWVAQQQVETWVGEAGATARAEAPWAAATAVTVNRSKEGVLVAVVMVLALTLVLRTNTWRRLARKKLVAQSIQAPEPITYGGVLADPELKDTIYSIIPNHRHMLARYLWRDSHTRQEYWWLIQIIAPINRLPPELLQQILLIIIDETTDPPLALMLVCKYWNTTLTSIWASLTLGAGTPKYAVTRKLQRNQWLLDVLVNTEIDRGHFTPSVVACEAIFAAIEAASRWRTFIVESFPGQADSAEHLVNDGLQQCSNAVMSRLRTFKIKCACEMSPLLNCLLTILGTSASGELTTVEINSANVLSFLVPTHSSVFRSVTKLSLDTPGLRDPVDLLPHLHQLGILIASHLTLPIYHDDVDLPFVHTLRHLQLRAISI